MDKRVELDFTPEFELIIERLKKEIPHDDVYGYLVFLIEKMSDITHHLYSIDSEVYTQICLEDEDSLLFLNVLGHLDKVSRGL